MTPNAIQAALPGTLLWDKGMPGSIRGLHVRVLAATNKRIFYLYYRTRQGRQRRPKIGDFSQITLQEARRRARVLLDQVSIGLDPKGDWEKAKEERFIYQLFNEVWKRYWDCERFQKSGHAKEVKNLYTRHIAAPFGPLKLSELTSPMVQDWHLVRRKTPTAANRALEVLSKMFRFAESREWVKTNPCRLVRAFSERKRSRFASEQEIQKLGAALREESQTNPRCAAFLYLLALTGSRPSAIERAMQEQLQRQEKDGETFGILTLGGKSAGRGLEDKVVIPPSGMKILDSLKTPDGSLIGCKYPRKMWTRVKKKAGCPDLWARDWRRTFATVGLSSGHEVGLIGELLNHKSTQTTSTYAKLFPAKRMEVAREIGSRVESLLGAPNVQDENR